MRASPETGGTWTTLSTETLYAFNGAEDMNTFATTSGTIGTGNTNVTRSDGTVNGGSCKMKPLPVGDFVQVRMRGIDSTVSPPQAYLTILGMPNSAG